VRPSIAIGVVGVLAVVAAPVAVAAPATAGAPLALTATAAVGGHTPDPGFTPQERRSAMAEARADAAQTARTLHLGAREALLVKDVVRDADGAEHVRYERTYAGLPVIGGDLVVHESPGGEIRDVSWASRDRIAVPSTTPEVSAEQADRAAAQDNPGRRSSTEARQVVFAAEHRPVLAWESTITGRSEDGTPVVDLVYADAHTGKQLAVLPQVLTADGTGYSLYSGTVSIQTSPNGSGYDLDDTTRGGHLTYDANNSTSTSRGTLMTDADNVWGNGSTSSRQSAAVDAHFGAARTWDYYKNAFGRTGIRNDGVAAYSRVHYGNAYENAFWDDSCFCMTYGDGGTTFSPLTSLDVAGHEMTHGVTSATAGLNYSGDAGGLNESTSDVFGTMVEFSANTASDPGDYYIGEEIAKDGSWLRRMDDPSLDGASVSCWTASTGNLDPHYSSGVGNHLFYLLAEGTGTKTIGGRTHSATACNGATLSGIGRDQAAAIWYRALTVYMTSTTSYPQAANDMVKAAADLYGATSAQCTATVNAWKGVSVAPSQTCGGSTPPPSGGNLLVNPGFESGATGWSSTSGVVTSSPYAFPHSGSYYAWLDGYGSSHTDTLSQSVTIPSASSATLSFYLYVGTDETTCCTAYDTLRVQVLTGGTTRTLATFSNLDAGSSYVRRTVDLSGYTGRTVTLRFRGVEDYSAATSFLVDDTSLTTG
jgi:Zn-dependent metalloprotease